MFLPLRGQEYRVEETKYANSLSILVYTSTYIMQ